MNSKTFYNLNTLVQVQVWDFYPVEELTYTPARKTKWWLFQKARPEGFMRNFYLGSSKFYTREQIEGKNFSCYAHLIIKDNEVFDKPQVKLVFANDHEYYQTFENFNDAVNWGSEQAHQGNNVVLKIK